MHIYRFVDASHKKENNSIIFDKKFIKNPYFFETYVIIKKYAAVIRDQTLRMTADLRSEQHGNTVMAKYSVPL